MSRVDNEIIHKQLNWRYATKKFDATKKIRESDLNILLECLRLSASSYGLQPWKFIVVQNPEFRKQLFEVSWKQSPVIEASHFIVLTYKENMDETFVDKHVAKMAQTHSSTVEAFAGFKSAIMGDLVSGPRSSTVNSWAQRQTYIAMGTFLTTAAMMEIDALPMEGLNPTEYDRILGLNGTGFKTVAAIACGYRSTEDRFQNNKKVRFDAKDVIEFK